MTKVLHVIGGMGRGGAPSFIINNLKKIDTSKIQFDFLVRNNNCVFTDIIEDKGGHVFVVPAFPQHLLGNYKQTRAFFKEHANEYQAVHVHANALIYILPLILAKKHGIRKIILHSHNTQSNAGFGKYIHCFNRLFVSKLANVFLACGIDAGKWMYGDKKYEVINNAVDVDHFAYNEKYRNEIRKEIGVSDETFVIGNVGRFEQAKNHDFLIDIFNDYLKINPNSLLLLPGEGSLWQKMKDKADKLGISNNIYFAGVRSDIHKLYSAMDMLLMPSLFEGLPFVAIEAQCSGLKCLLSTNVTSEATITDLCISESLQSDTKVWCDLIEIIREKKVIRQEFAKIVSEKKYDINYTANRLCEIYTKYK